MSTLKPVGDHVIVRPSTAEETSKAGIILPDTVDKQRPERGEVIAVGPGRLLDNGTRAPIEASVGDTVMFKKYAPDEVKLEGQEYLVIRGEDIIAIIS